MRKRWAVRFLIVMITVVGLGTAGPMAAGQAPSNDEIDSATLVTEPLPFVDEVSTAEATTAPDDPSCTIDPQRPESATVWYRYTPENDISIEVNAAAEHDTTLSAYLDLEGELTQIACNYDAGFGDSRIDITVEAGETVLFMVATHLDFQGPGNTRFSVYVEGQGPSAAASSATKWGPPFWLATAMFVTAAGATVVCVLKRRLAFGAAGVAASAFTAFVAFDLRDTEPDMSLVTAFIVLLVIAVGSPLIILAVVGASQPAKPSSWWAKRTPPNDGHNSSP